MPDIFQFEDYDKCLYHSIEADPTYCTFTLQLRPEKPENSTKIWKIIQEVCSSDRNYRHDLLRYGTCASTHCSNFNGTLSECLSQSYTTQYQNLGLLGEISAIQCETKNFKHEIGTLDVVILALLGIYVLFVVTTTIWLEFAKYQARTKVDPGQHENKTSSIQNFFSVFSVVDNVRSLITVSHKTKNYMMFLQTMRFATSIVVILVHVAGSGRGTPVLNPLRVEQTTNTLFNMILAQVGMIVQVFFVMSSWLVAVSFFKKMEHDRKVGLDYVVRSILRRYLRFATGEIVLIGLHATWLVHLSRGPFWEPVMGTEYKMCRARWWTNLLFFNNFVIDDGVCLIHTWYLSVDFQFTVLGLLILWLTQKKPKHLFLALSFVAAFQVIFMFVYLAWNNFELAVIFTPELSYGFKFLASKEWQATWTSTYSNLAGLVFGLLFGYLQVKHQSERFFTKRKHTILWWILTTLLVIGIPLFSSFYMTTDYYSNSRWFAAAYGSVDKGLFVFGVGLLIFGMGQELGGVVRKAFEWVSMHTMGRLSFGAYLIHFTFVQIDTGLRRPHFVSEYSLVCETIVNVVLSYLSSVILTAFVLIPMDGLTKKLI
ncbi:hypothetical protein Zmor_018924 [Zophobas morio]|uniref:Acyltransferase 3 domain-containing protein n=2 Tax=Zophobas morio TaxID=2755281 RepID=A0AA38ME38_9CUCU|nr:hypothetical protein Zmor_018924 [Zophobas morio]